jgi:hypothetical protein
MYTHNLSVVIFSFCIRKARSSEAIQLFQLLELVTKSRSSFGDTPTWITSYENL